jgi:hypothetical protein
MGPVTILVKGSVAWCSGIGLIGPAALSEHIDEFQKEGAFQIAEIYAYRGETDQAFERLERAYKQRDGGLSQMKGDPLLRSLERDPCYPAFLKKMKLPID